MKAVSLFAGAGGFDVGLRAAGHQIMLATDWWERAAETYQTNDDADTPYLVGDINKIAPDVVKRSRGADLVVGGPPCQDFSTAGAKQQGKRASLTIRFAETVVKIRPEWVVMENVNTITSLGRSYVATALAVLRAAGYGITTIRLNAVDFGAPQRRRRFFIIGHLGGPPDEMKHAMDGYKTERVSVREWHPGIVRGPDATRYFYIHPWHFGRRAVFSVDDACPTIRGQTRPMSANYQPHRLDATTNLDEVRALTTRERAIIQTFPGSYEFVGPKSDQEQQIGNAVPPLLASKLGRMLDEWDGGATEQRTMEVFL